MSPFMKTDPADWIVSNDLAFALWDIEPETPGHALVITRRVVPTWFDANYDELVALIDLVDDVRAAIEHEYGIPDGYNIGTNVGAAAGQVVDHLHVHVIPRYDGDGLGQHGVRKVLGRRHG